MATVVEEVLTSCGMTEADLAKSPCDLLEEVQRAAAMKILELMPCVGTPDRLGDEHYDHRKNIESLLRIMKASEMFCRVKASRAFSAFSIPNAGCGCGCPSSDELHERYLACCQPSTKVGHGNS